jgi:phi13 family phage major tail protein
MSDNKVKYGLKNVHYAVATIASDGSATYGTVKPWPGAVNLSLDAQGGTTKFRADNVNYWVGQSNNSYEGDLETALIPEDFRVAVLGESVDDNGVVVEDVEAKTVPFALMFEFAGDAKSTRHVLYNCTATRPSVSGSTTDEEIEPQTETVTITTGSVYFASYDGGKNLSRARCFEGDSEYDDFFDTVYTPVTPTP